MAVLLTKLINKSITSFTIPDTWKNAVVIPVQKSNQSSSLSNFHPISILNVFSKLLDRVVFDQVVNHFTTLGLRQLYWRNFGHNRHQKASSIMLA